MKMTTRGWMPLAVQTHTRKSTSRFVIHWDTPLEQTQAIFAVFAMFGVTDEMPMGMDESCNLLHSCGYCLVVNFFLVWRMDPNNWTLFQLHCEVAQLTASTSQTEQMKTKLGQNIKCTVLVWDDFSHSETVIRSKVWMEVSWDSKVSYQGYLLQLKLMGLGKNWPGCNSCMVTDSSNGRISATDWVSFSEWTQFCRGRAVKTEQIQGKNLSVTCHLA